ncbi:MAG: hypothetical protein DWQ36_20360 [Acidobacteria bacterium]|nr:MAG: hypothetical protein DWQ36_20360 [Acidobacteriota bacterium]
MHDAAPLRLPPRSRPALLAAVALLLCSLQSLAAAPGEGSVAEEPSTAGAGEQRAPHRFVSEHQGTFGGRALRYRAIAGETFLYDDEQQPKAAIFTFAYLEIDPPRAKPVAFVWNGGPGSSSVWLHMGTFGPRRVVVPSDARSAGAPPYPIEDNGLTPLDLVDMVFVDPVGTGYSRALGEHEPKEFWSLDGDAASIAELIRAFVTEHGRWNAAKYLIGESFGSTRAAAVADLLEGRGSVSLNGLILVSQALDYQGSTPAHDNLRSYLTYLPTLAATAWYHGKIERMGTAATLEGLLDETRRFAYDEYGSALLRGSSLPAGERVRIRDRLAALTGLDPAYIERSDLRPLADRFRKELLREKGLAVGRLDGRYTGDDLDDVAERPAGDPAGDAIDSAYAAALHEVMRGELGVDLPTMQYNLSGPPELGQSWSYRPEGGGWWEPSYVNVARRLAEAMSRNPELEVLVANGYDGFATPFFDAEVTFDRHGIPRERVQFTYYEAGHMMYLHHPSHERFLADVRAFLERTLAVAGVP